MAEKYALILHDLAEKEFAKEFKAFLEELLGFAWTLIAYEPNRGMTLQDKQDEFINNARMAIFLFTAGATSKKDGKEQPSGSVLLEYGRLSKILPSEKVICLLEPGCVLPVIENKACIPLNRSNTHDFLESLVSLIKELKGVNLYKVPSNAQNKIDLKTTAQPKIDQEYVNKIDVKVQSVIHYLSTLKNGYATDTALDSYLSQTLKLNGQDINFLTNNIKTHYAHLIHYMVSAVGICWELYPNGFEVAELIAERLRVNRSNRLAEYAKRKSLS